MKLKDCSSSGTANWEVMVEGSEWKRLLNQAEKRCYNQVRVPGFRPGTAPASKWRKQLNSTMILRQAHQLAGPKAYRFAQSQINNFNSRPKMTIKKIDFQQYCLVFSWVKPMSEVKLKRYQNITVAVPKRKAVTESEIRAEIIKRKKIFAALVSVDRPAKKGDVVVINYVGYLDNQKIKHSAVQDLTLELGSHKTIAEFETHLMGVTTGSNRTFSVRFPANHFNPQFQNKTIRFQVQINRVAQYQLPTIAELVSKAKLPPSVKTESDFKHYVADQLIQHQKQTTKDNFIDELVRKIAQESKIQPAPDQLQTELQKLKRSFSNELRQRGYSLTSYKRRSGLSDDFINSQLMIDAELTLLRKMVLLAVRQQANIKPSLEQIKTEQKLQFGDQPTINSAQRLAIENRLSEKLTIDFLFTHNNGSEPKKPDS